MVLPPGDHRRGINTADYTVHFLSRSAMPQRDIGIVGVSVAGTESKSMTVGSSVSHQRVGLVHRFWFFE